MTCRIDKLYYPNGNIRRKIYYVNNEYHRVDGPALIFYYKTGEVHQKYYYLNGKSVNVNSDEEFEKYVKTLILK